MTVSSVTIKPVESLKNWFKVTLISRKDGIGETSMELLCSEETLRQMRGEIAKVLPAAPTPENEPDWLQAFRDMDK